MRPLLCVLLGALGRLAPERAGLPAGLCLARLEVGGRLETHRCTLIR